MSAIYSRPPFEDDNTKIDKSHPLMICTLSTAKSHSLRNNLRRYARQVLLSCCTNAEPNDQTCCGASKIIRSPCYVEIDPAFLSFAHGRYMSFRN